MFIVVFFVFNIFCFMDRFSCRLKIFLRGWIILVELMYCILWWILINKCVRGVGKVVLIIIMDFSVFCMMFFRVNGWILIFFFVSICDLLFVVILF